MSDSVILYDVVVLKEAIPEHNLAAGQYGTVTEVIRYDQFEVEFRDEHRIIAQIPLNVSQVQVLRFESTLDDSEFWRLIEDARAKSEGSTQRELDLLTDMLVERSIADIYIFGKLCKKYMWFAYRHEMWSVAIAIQGGMCSDDAFEDFLGWLVAQGESIYYDALQDPEVLLDLVEVKCDYGWVYGDITIGINFAYYNAYEKKTGEEIQFGAGYPARPILMGQFWDEETLRQKYPKLSAKFFAGECEEESE